MTGFVYDYNSAQSDSTDQGVMGAYSSDQLPVLSGLARSFAVSDRWFSSVPTQTFPNRAFAACGTSLGKLTNSEISDTTYASTTTIFNVLGQAGKTWGVYYQGGPGSEIASGVPVWDVATQYLFPQLNNAPGGQIRTVDEPSDSNSFMVALQNGTLPNFCFLEPKWGGGPAALPAIQGNDYHPVSNVGPCEYDLYELYKSIIGSSQWSNMLFVITFDEHGGTYDHEPPTVTISPDGIPGDQNFQFNRLGVRVPTLLISPYIPAGLVFRSPSYNDSAAVQPDFDHTSLIATLLLWAGVDPTSGVLGQRVANAPTFEQVFSTTARTDKPTFNLPSSYGPSPKQAWPFTDPAPLYASGKPLQAKRVNVKDFRAICDEARKNPDELHDRLRKLRYDI